MDTGLKDRVVLVTGAGSGIGNATARALSNEGARIVAADLRPPPGGYPADWHAVEADLTAVGAGARAVSAATAHWGRLDGLVACAGVYETHSLADLDETRFDRTYAVNVRAVFSCAQAAIPAMAAGGWGRIVLLGSVAAETGGASAGAAYVSSKAAVVGLTRSLAQAAGRHGITVNCVLPGIIETPMTEVMDAATKAELTARTPLRRTGTAQDVADVIVMLCADGARYVTGARIDVNGGLVMT